MTIMYRSRYGIPNTVPLPIVTNRLENWPATWWFWEM